MYNNDDLVHITSFDGIKGKSEIIQYNVYNGSDVNELAQEILTNFLNSPSHKKNIPQEASFFGKSNESYETVYVCRHCLTIKMN